METPKQQRSNKNLKESSSKTSIHDLPHSILTHILSFLPTTDAAIQTSAVAPPWRRLWHSVPTINFDMQAFYLSRAPRPRSEARQLFAEMLSRALFHRPHHFAVRTFRLSLPYKDYDKNRSLFDNYVNFWLMSVIGSKAEELDLDFSQREYEEEDDGFLRPYEFHYLVLADSSVKVLKLSCCELCRPPGHVPLSSKVYSIREIHLEEVNYCTKELAHLLAMCVNLEILSLVNVEFAEVCKIQTKSLKIFIFLGPDHDNYYDWDDSVDICAPNLESLILHGSSDRKYSLKVSSSLVAADVEFPGRSWRDFASWTTLLISLDGIERLTIQNMWTWYRYGVGEKRRQLSQLIEKPVEDVFSETFVFHKLKHVELLTGFSEEDILGLEILLKKCPQLETLALVKKYDSFNELKGPIETSFVLQMPRLRLVEMKKFQETEGELFVVGLLKNQGVVLEKIVAYPENMDGESGHSFVL